jgi:glycosyltransferase involved in cell wall biosynthesis
MDAPLRADGLRIALVTETFPPEINGVAMTLHRLVSALARRHQVTVVRPRQPAGIPSAPLPEGVTELLRPGFAVPRCGFRFGMPAPIALDLAWRRARPDVVHVATEGPLGLSALATARRMGIAVTTSFHTNFHDYSRYYGIGVFHGLVSWYLRRFHNRARRTLVPSRDLLRSLERLGYRNLAMFGRGVDTSLFSPARRDDALRASWGADHTDLVVLHVGRVAPEKNMPLAFSAFRRIAERRPEARLVVVGDGPTRAQYAREFPFARFVGAQIGADLARHYASADLFLFPSMSETFGNVALEAMASGLPVVAFDYAAPQRYIRHAHDGWLAPFGDEASFLEMADAAALSARTLRTFGERARAAVLAAPWETVFAQFEGELAAAVQEHRLGIASPEDPAADRLLRG